MHSNEYKQAIYWSSGSCDLLCLMYYENQNIIAQMRELFGARMLVRTSLNVYPFPVQVIYISVR